MTLLRVLLLSSILMVSVQSFPSTTRNYKNESTAQPETKETTDHSPVLTENPKKFLDIHTNSKREPSIEELVFKRPKEGLSVQKGTTREKYTIANLPTRNENAKINLLDSSKDNEINIDGKDELYKLNTTDTSKSEDLLSEAQTKRDQRLFDSQEMSSIIGGQPKYFYDAMRLIYPFPELSETAKPIDRFPELTETPKPNHNFPKLVEKSYERSSYESLELGGPVLYPKSVLMRDIDKYYREI